MDYLLPTAADRNYYYRQDNNAVEKLKQALYNGVRADLLRELQEHGGMVMDKINRVFQDAHLNSIFETCGTSAVINVGGSLGALPAIDVIAYPGGYKPQPEDVATMCANDPNMQAMLNVGLNMPVGTVPGNRIAQWHQVVARVVLGLQAQWTHGLTFADCAAAVKAGKGIVLLLSNPGHYIGVDGYSEERDALRFKDSWGGRKPKWKGDGFGRWLPRAEYDQVQVFDASGNPTLTTVNRDHATLIWR